MGGRSARALNYGSEPVPNFLFLIKKSFLVIPLRGSNGSRTSPASPHPACSLYITRCPKGSFRFQGLEDQGQGGVRIQEAKGQAQQGLWGLSPFLPSTSPLPHASASLVPCILLRAGTPLHIISLSTTAGQDVDALWRSGGG